MKRNIIVLAVIAALAGGVSCKIGNSESAQIDSCYLIFDYIVDGGHTVAQTLSHYGTIDSGEFSACCVATAPAACASAPNPSSEADCLAQYTDACVLIEEWSGGTGGDGLAEEGPDEAAEQGDGNDGVDDTGGTCDEDLGLYMCQGTVYGIHKRVGSSSTQRDFTTPSNVYYHCITGDEMTVPLPKQATNDTSFLFKECDDICEAMDWDWPPEPMSSGWEYSHTVCLFQNAPTGYITGLDATPDNLIPNDAAGGPSTCPFYDDTVMIPFVEDADGMECLAETCGDWNPNSNITTSTNAITRVITTSMSRAYLTSLYGNWEDVYNCDPTARFDVATWKMTGMVSGDLLYRIGFRSNDKTLTAQQTGGTVININSGIGLESALSLLLNPAYSSFVITLQRQAVGGSWQNWTINLTLT